ncbi:hypothetical protein [Nocardia tenerifensis]|uniref:hypothetical protein n=1 Tax=Nocardia tenerifensis TaxID=228006 RepID=UPI0002E89235|nr:hypothetical protein [Nocardia tenerifensis]
MPMIGQALYTWSTETLSGTTGFGFVSASPSLAPRIPWLHSISKTLTRYEPLAAGARSDPLGFDAVLPVRSVVDDTAVVAFKAYQGDDKFHRPGRYSVQFFVAESAALPLSTVFRLRAALVLQPSTLRLDESPSLDDLDIESPGLLDAYDASGERAAQLIAALRSTNWTHLDVGAAELPAVVDAMSVLHPAWDACATLQLLSVRPSLLWRLALRAPVAVGDHRTAANRVLALESGDEKWKTLRSSLANATTADQLTLSWDLLQRKDDTVIPAVSASAGTNSITDAVREYVGGNGARLKRLMDAQPEGVPDCRRSCWPIW